MVDPGANGGLAGSDMRVIHKPHRKINIQGIDNHEVTGLDVVTAATLLNTSQGKVIGIFNEYAYLGKGSSIHSSGQLEWFKTNVDEKSVKVGGTQLITTLDGHSVPLLIKDGLAYATSLGRPTEQDMDTYPHVFFTSPDEWDPSVLDHDPPHLDGLDPSQVPDQPFGDPMFDAYGDFNERIIANLNTLLDAPPGDCGSYTEISSVFTANLHQSSPQEPDWNALHPFFAWMMNGTPQSLTMILHTLMDWTPVKSLTNPLVTPCLMLMVISMSTSLPTSTPSWMHLQEIVGHTQKSLLVSQPISIRVLTEVDNLQGIYPLKDEWVFGCSLKTRLADQTKDSKTEVVMVK